MFGTKRRLGALQAQVAELQADIKALWSALGNTQSALGDVQKAVDQLDVVELERMRGSVLNALRAYRRVVTAQDHAGPTNGEGKVSQHPLEPIVPPGPRRNY